jgi:hypothetical protein
MPLKPHWQFQFNDVEETMDFDQQSIINGIVNKILAENRLATEIGDISADQGKRLQDAFLKVGDTVFEDASLPIEYMRHFCFGAGKAKIFQLTDLVSEDRGARARVYGEVVRRSLEVLTLREKSGNYTPSSGSVIDPEITIFQSNFNTTKWWGALGTFGVTFEKVASVPPDRPFPVLLSGCNLYQWHPTENRPTRKIHEMGARLLALGFANNFRMCATPMVISVDPKMKRVLEWSTFKQTMPAGRADAIDMMLRAAKNYPIDAAKALIGAIRK